MGASPGVVNPHRCMGLGSKVGGKEHPHASRAHALASATRSQPRDGTDQHRRGSETWGTFRKAKTWLARGTDITHRAEERWQNSPVCVRTVVVPGRA